MIKFAYIYAMPGYTNSTISQNTPKEATFLSVAVDMHHREQAIDISKKLVEEYGVNMIELCGGLANADLVSKIKQKVGPNVAIGQVMYGPEFRRPLVDLLNL